MGSFEQGMVMAGNDAILFTSWELIVSIFLFDHHGQEKPGAGS
jgi:hypothetical protein